MTNPPQGHTGPATDTGTGSPGAVLGASHPGAAHPGGAYPGAAYPPAGYPYAAYPGGPYAGAAPNAAYPGAPTAWGPPPSVGFAPMPQYSAPGGRMLAEATDRLLARIIDGFILMVPTLLINVPLTIGAVFLVADLFENGPSDGGDVLRLFLVFFGLIALLTLVNGVVSYVYDVVYVHRTGQTIGKRVMKIRIVRLDDGGPIEVGHARKRWLAYEGASLLSAIPGVGSVISMYVMVDALWLLWDKPNRQCLHDKYAKTAVVKLTDADLAAARQA